MVFTRTLATVVACCLVVGACTEHKATVEVGENVLKTAQELRNIGDAFSLCGTTPIFRAFQEELQRSRNLEDALEAAKKEVESIKAQDPRIIQVNLKSHNDYGNTRVTAKLYKDGQLAEQRELFSGTLLANQGEIITGLSFNTLADKDATVHFDMYVATKEKDQGARVDISFMEVSLSGTAKPGQVFQPDLKWGDPAWQMSHAVEWRLK